MPTYEYICDHRHEVEIRQSINDGALSVCPREDCEAPAHRKISMGGGFLTGDGFSGTPAGGGDRCGQAGFT